MLVRRDIALLGEEYHRKIPLPLGLLALTVTLPGPQREPPTEEGATGALVVLTVKVTDTRVLSQPVIASATATR